MLPYMSGNKRNLFELPEQSANAKEVCNISEKKVRSPELSVILINLSGRFEFFNCVSDR